MRRGVGGYKHMVCIPLIQKRGVHVPLVPTPVVVQVAIERMTDLCVARHDFGQPVVGHAVRYARFRRPEHEDTVDVGTSDAICRPHCLFIDVIQTLSLRACY